MRARLLIIVVSMLLGAIVPAHAARLPDKTASTGATPALQPIRWQPWSEELFAQAKREKRYILLDLEAVWCHWCHVMEETTYHDAKVANAIAQHYIAVKVDQDARPDLSRRYDEYGWPATVVFDADGREIVKRRGYIPPARMLSMLKAIVDDPSPIKYLDQATVEASSDTHLLADSVRKELTRRFEMSHDYVRGGMDQEQKFMDRETVEYAMVLAQNGNKKAEKIARQDLDGARHLIDPVWGGVYQYSTDRDWVHPHFEKLLQIQADYLRIYALAYLTFGERAYLDAAKDIHRYVAAFLQSPEGAFYVSQDADLKPGEHSGEYFALDDAKRRKLGVPRVDQHLYAREQGWMIQGSALLYSATLDQRYLQDAAAAAQWTLEQRALPGGGFRHDATDSGGPYLDDAVSMGRALLALYAVTGERKWLTQASATAQFVRKQFALPHGGYATAALRNQVLKPKPQIDENIAAARYFNLLARYTGDASYRADAERAMRYLASREVALLRGTETGILLAESEMSTDPVHLTIVGGKGDAAAQALFKSALRVPSGYRRIEWWDRNEGALPNSDVQYPEMAQAAAYVCTNGACSLPQFDAKNLLTLATSLNKDPNR